MAACAQADAVSTAARKQLAFMPLELFDPVNDYETRSAEEWLELGRAEGGTPAQTLIFVGDDK